MNDKIWYVVRNTPGVRLIIGAETRPIPIEDEQYEKIVAEVREKNVKLTTRNSFKVDDVVVIRETNFKNMKGRIAEVDDLRGQVTVMVEFMGRTTPVSLSFDKVELA